MGEGRTMGIFYLTPVNVMFLISSVAFFISLSECSFKLEESAVSIGICTISLLIMLFMIFIAAGLIMNAFYGVEKYAKFNLRCMVSWWGLIAADAVFSSRIVLSRMCLYGFFTMFVSLGIWTQVVKWKFFKALEKYHYDVYYKFCTLSIIGNKRFRYLEEEAERILQQGSAPEMEEAVLKEKACFPIMLAQFEIFVFTIVVICTFGIAYPNRIGGDF